MKRAAMYKSGMPRKKPAHDEKKPKRPGFMLYCSKEEQAVFSRAAKAEGYGQRGRNTWALYHLRQVIQDRHGGQQDT